MTTTQTGARTAGRIGENAPRPGVPCVLTGFGFAVVPDVK